MEEDVGGRLREVLVVIGVAVTWLVVAAGVPELLIVLVAVLGIVWLALRPRKKKPSSGIVRVRRAFFRAFWPAS